MRNLIWSFVERMFPRAASAIIMIFLAAMVTPEVVGVYALGILALTFFQSVTDASVRQIAVRAVGTASGRAFLKKYQEIVLPTGTVFILVCLVSIYLYVGQDSVDLVWALSPLIAVPVICVLRVEAVARLQHDSDWKLLARMQVISAAISLTVSIPMLFVTRSLWASSSQLVLTELVFTILARRAVASKTAVRSAEEIGSEVVREYGHVSMYSALGWAQGQADRVLLTLLAGPVALGLYSFAQSLSRSVGDALSASTANVLRPKLLSGQLSRDEIKERTAPLLFRACLMSGVSTAAVILGAKFVFPLFLSDQWDPAIDATGIMALAVGPTMLAWSTTVVMISMGRIKWAAPIKVIGVIMALPIALLAVADVRNAAIVMVARDVLIMGLMLWAAKGAIGFKTIGHFSVWFVLLAALTLLIG